MTRPLIQIGDETREMTETEYALHQADVQAEAEATAAALAHDAARQSALAKLAALGLTDAEIAALVA